VWKTIIRFGLCKKADIITKYKQQQQQQEKASEVTVIIGYTKWHGNETNTHIQPQHGHRRQQHTRRQRGNRQRQQRRRTAIRQFVHGSDVDDVTRLASSMT